MGRGRKMGKINIAQAQEAKRRKYIEDSFSEIQRPVRQKGDRDTYQMRPLWQDW